MDTEKLFKDLTNDIRLQGVPIEYICRIAIVVLDLLNGNKYIFKIGE